MKSYSMKPNDARKVTTIGRFKNDKNCSSMNYHQEKQGGIFNGFLKRLYQEDAVNTPKIESLTKKEKRSNKKYTESSGDAPENVSNSLHVEKSENPLLNQQIKGFMIPKNFEIDVDKSIFSNPPHKMEDMKDISQAIGSYIQNVERKGDSESRDNQMSYSDQSIDTKDKAGYSKSKSKTIYNQATIEESYGSQAANSYLLMKRKSMEKSFRK